MQAPCGWCLLLKQHWASSMVQWVRALVLKAYLDSTRGTRDGRRLDPFGGGGELTPKLSPDLHIHAHNTVHDTVHKYSCLTT